MREIVVFEPAGRACVRPVRRRGGDVTPLNRMLPGSRDLGRFLQWIVEVLDGRRSVVQLADRLAPGLARWLRDAAARDQAGRDQAGRDQAGRDQAGRDRAGERRTVLAHHLRVVGADVLEFWGTVSAGCERVHAMAGRVEVHGTSWWCTAFDIVTPGCTGPLDRTGPPAAGVRGTGRRSAGRRQAGAG